jgi:hypothetical protein
VPLLPVLRAGPPQSTPLAGDPHARREGIDFQQCNNDKAAVMGILERGKKGESKIRAKVVDNTKKKTSQAEIRNHVLVGSAIFTDALKSYEGLDEFSMK